MSDDLISRQVALEAIKHAELGMEYGAVAALPTIEERETGRWCVTPDGRLVCSNCYNNPTNRIIVDGSLIYDMTPIRERMKYCPYCGARMVEGEEHEL